jgi:hypothetical protein
MLNVILLIVSFLSVKMLNLILLNVIKLNVIMLNEIILNVVAPADSTSRLSFLTKKSTSVVTSFDKNTQTVVVRFQF